MEILSRNINTLPFLLDWSSPGDHKGGIDFFPFTKKSRIHFGAKDDPFWTRSMLWKRGHRLRRLGYEIKGNLTNGYRIVSSPDRAYPWELFRGLETDRFGHTCLYFPEIDSTNSFAWEIARQGVPEGTVVVAEYQSRGRGRLGRSWCSPAGGNIYATLILRPSIPAVQAGQVSLIAALAAARAIQGVTEIRPAVKWPNDIFLEGRKVAGILSEAHSPGKVIEVICCGIGINVHVRGSDLPPEVRSRAAALAEFSSRVLSRIIILQEFLRQFEELYDMFSVQGFSALLPEWRTWSMLEGRRVMVHGADGEVTGKVVGINDVGALLLESDEGAVTPFFAGDVTIPMEGSGGQCCW